MRSQTRSGSHGWRLIACLVVFSTVSIASTQRIPRTQARQAPQLQWPQITLQQVADGLESPVHLTHAGDNSGRIFVVEQSGRIQMIQNGSVQPTPFLDIAGRVKYGGEEGLLSVAFPPQFSIKQYFYVYYTKLDGNNVLSRFMVSNHPNQADPNSEQPILVFNHPQNSNHNGGQLAFGPDGYLYIGTGDGGGSGDPHQNAQNPGSLLGKLLRIDTELISLPPVSGSNRIALPIISRNSSRTTTGAMTYAIPPDNPFLANSAYRPEIWSLGLRNPWRFSFDRNTGDLYIGDVGQGSYEEVDLQWAGSAGGENYGWNKMEGFECYPIGTTCSKAGLTLPVFAYPTHVNGSCAVTGGFVYRGSAYTGLQGIYFAGDYCNGIIYGLQWDGQGFQSQPLLDTQANISSFGEDQAGELYVADLQGSIYRLAQIVP